MRPWLQLDVPLPAPSTFAVPARPSHALRAAALIGIAAACGDGGTNPNPNPAPFSIAVASGNNQTATAGSVLPQPLVVRVADAADQDLPDITVAWEVTAGGGTLSTQTSVTDTAGHAQVVYLLGAAAGNNGVRATVQGTTLTVPFSATATAPPSGGTPSELLLVSGNNQSAGVNTALPQPFVVRVVDAGGQPLAGITVTWTVTAGGGTLTQATVTSDASGNASNGYQTGPTAGTESVTAAVASNPSLTLTFNVTVTTVAGSGPSSPSAGDHR